MPVGYDFYALKPLYIASSGGFVLAFSVGQLVPDDTVASQGWVTGVDVQVLGTPPPSATNFLVLLDTDGVPYIQAVS